VSDPTNVLALDDLKTLSGHSIRLVVALEEDIKKLQDRVFGIDEEVSELIGGWSAYAPMASRRPPGASSRSRRYYVPRCRIARRGPRRRRKY
jgi:hypothetical protein